MWLTFCSLHRDGTLPTKQKIIALKWLSQTSTYFLFTGAARVTATCITVYKVLGIVKLTDESGSFFSGIYGSGVFVWTDCLKAGREESEDMVFGAKKVLKIVQKIAESGGLSLKKWAWRVTD